MDATNEILPFEHEDFGKLRVVGKDGEPWFVASDVAKSLGYRDAASMTRRLDDDEKGTRSACTLGGRQSMTIINEPGLYNAVLGSRMPEAKAFKRWVTHEVLPSIRKRGAYLTSEKVEEVLTDPDTIIRLATSLKEERARRERLQAENDEMRPKALFADAVSASKSSILVGELAKMLRQNGVEVGQNRLFSWMREHGYLMKGGSSYNIPTQRAMELGLFTIKETTVTHSDGHTTISKTPKVTGKGQQYFVDMFLDGRAVA